MGVPSSQTIHATAVVFAGQGVLISGASGSGKSALALELLALGAELIADDRVTVTPRDGGLIASCPPAISGKIEARFVGILGAVPAEPAPVTLFIDMDQIEQCRLPPPRTQELCGIRLTSLHKTENGYFAAAIVQYLKGAKASRSYPDAG